jgi:hypothetical protein
MTIATGVPASQSGHSVRLARLRLGQEIDLDDVVAGAERPEVEVERPAPAGVDWRQVAGARVARGARDPAHRTGMVEFSRHVLQDAIDIGQLPDWVDVDGIAATFVTLMEGFVIVAEESGPISPEEARRGVHSLLELLLAAPPQAPAAVEKLRAEAAAAPRAPD